MSHYPGAEIAKELLQLKGETRERVILKLADTGAFPLALANFVTIAGSAKDAAGVLHTYAYDVTFDYFSLGTDDDYIRMPMWPITAQWILDSWHCCLPTPKMVDEIHKHATPLLMVTSTTARESTATYVKTNDAIRATLAKKNVRLGALISGHRKDVVISKGLASHAKNVVIYGGLRSAGVWWQTAPNASSHDNRYVDYSHGFRCVRWEMKLDGKPADVRTVLQDANLAPLLSSERALTRVAYPLLPTK